MITRQDIIDAIQAVADVNRDLIALLDPNNSGQPRALTSPEDLLKAKEISDRAEVAHRRIVELRNELNGEPPSAPH